MKRVGTVALVACVLVGVLASAARALPPSAPGPFGAQAGAGQGVEAVAHAPDGSTFIGGTFLHVCRAADLFQMDCTSRLRLAKLDPSGRLLPWSVDVTAPSGGPRIASLALSGDTLYIGGVFTTVGGEARTNIAAVDADSGAVLSGVGEGANAANDAVNALALDGSTLFAGGAFTTIGSLSRNRLAALDANPVSADFGEATTSWAPGTAGVGQNTGGGARVSALAVHGGNVYAGGNFACLNDNQTVTDCGTGTTRPALAAWATATGGLQDFDVGLDEGDEVFGLDASGSTVYFGGSFDTVFAGEPEEEDRINLAATNDASTATAPDIEPWRIDATDPFSGNLDNGDVFALDVSGGRVVLGGGFTKLSSGGGSPITRRGAASVLADPEDATPTIDDWNPDLSNEVRTVVALPEAVYLGGRFNQVAGATRTQYAQFQPPRLSAPSGLANGTHGFGSRVTSAGPTAPFDITLTNTGTAAWSSSTIELQGGGANQFTLDSSDCPAALAPAASCTLQTRFDPSSTGAKTATLSVEVPDSGGAVATLNGTGAAPAPPTPPSPPNPPSNEFTIGKLEPNKKKGTGTLPVEVPGAGQVELVGTSKLKGAAARAAGAGEVELAVKATGKAKKKLRTRGKAKLAAEVTYTPDGGELNTQSSSLKLVKRSG